MFSGVGSRLSGFGISANWREEVLLHDGRRMEGKHTADKGGRHEIEVHEKNARNGKYRVEEV